MVNSSDLAEDRGESPNFLDSLASFKGKRLYFGVP